MSEAKQSHPELEIVEPAPPSSTRVHAELTRRLDALESADRTIIDTLARIERERSAHAIAKLAAALLVVGGAVASLAEQASRLLSAMGMVSP